MGKNKIINICMKWISKLKDKQTFIISDIELHDWMLENGFFKESNTSHYDNNMRRSMMQSIRNKEDAVKWVYNTIKIQELKGTVQDIESLNEYIRPFTDELTRADYISTCYTSTNMPPDVHIDLFIYRRVDILKYICGLRVT